MPLEYIPWNQLRSRLCDTCKDKISRHNQVAENMFKRKDIICEICIIKKQMLSYIS